MEQLFVATLPSPIAWHFILGFLENSNVDVTDVTTVYCSRSILEVGRESCIPDRQTGPGTATGALPHNFHPLLALIFLTFSNQCLVPCKQITNGTFVKVRQGQCMGTFPSSKILLIIWPGGKNFCKVGSIFSLGTLWDTTRKSQNTKYRKYISTEITFTIGLLCF